MYAYFREIQTKPLKINLTVIYPPPYYFCFDSITPQPQVILPCTYPSLTIFHIFSGSSHLIVTHHHVGIYANATDWSPLATSQPHLAPCSFPTSAVASHPSSLMHHRTSPRQHLATYAQSPIRRASRGRKPATDMLQLDVKVAKN